MSRIAVPERGAEALFGTQDENLRLLEDTFKVRIKTQGQELIVEGEPDAVERVTRIFQQLGTLMRDGYSVGPGDVRLAAQLLKEDEDTQLRDYLMKAAVRGGKKVVVPRSLNQRNYLDQINNHDMIFGIGPAGTGKCVAAGSLVLTDEGMVEIERLAQGMTAGEVQAIDLTVHGVDGPEPAASVYAGGESQTLRIRTRLGYEIEATLEHPLLVLGPDGQLCWRRADGLAAGDTLVLQRGQRMFGSSVAMAWAARAVPRDHGSKQFALELLDDEFAYFLGLLVGDGCVIRRNRIVFTSADAELTDAFDRIAARLGLNVMPNGARKHDHVIASPGLSYLLQHLGLPTGPAATKRIPRAILLAPEPMVAAFLAGLFDRDGSVEHRDRAITFSTVSRVLATQVQTVLLNFGILCNRSVKRERYRGRVHESEVLTITGREAEAFDALVGFRLGRKRSRRRPRPASGAEHKGLVFLEVAHITPSRAQVYDLTVPRTHSFVANGFVNHNTYLAVAQAVSSLVNKQVQRIVLARPAVEAGEKLGFLPGDLQDKVDPYLRPLYDALYDLLDYEKVARLLERNAIEVAPIAFMRGRTLNDAFVIIDEAQNTTTEQMKMVLTRTGFGSKVVITGDITQIDLPSGKVSGLVEAIAILSGVPGISFVFFDERDVVRHKLVQSIIRAYDAHAAAQSPAR